MKFLLTLILTLFSTNAVWADFSESTTVLHPFSPVDQPYIIDIRGVWPTDCHPGEQKPVITNYTGDTAVIEFETIVEHVTCNEVATPYRVLIDMSDVVVVDDTQASPMDIEVTIRFNGTDYVQNLRLNCICSPSARPALRPEAGLYESAQLHKQGLILARQNKRMAAYPLIYDEAGSSEWLFGGGGVVQELFIVDLYELTDGQCLGCAPVDEPPNMNAVGKLTMLMDSESVIQVKINDGMFQEYTQTVFGYGEFNLWDESEQVTVQAPDLRGRWAFSEATREDQMATLPPTSVLPLVFDIELRRDTNPPLPIITPPPEPAEGAAVAYYGIADMDGDLIAEMTCRHSGELICELTDLETDDTAERFDVQVLSLERMMITNTTTPDYGDSPGRGTVVRIE